VESKDKRLFVALVRICSVLKELEADIVHLSYCRRGGERRG